MTTFSRHFTVRKGQSPFSRQHEEIWDDPEKFWTVGNTRCVCDCGNDLQTYITEHWTLITFSLMDGFSDSNELEKQAHVKNNGFSFSGTVMNKITKLKKNKPNRNKKCINQSNQST